MKKVVITGATGAIGRALIKVCIEADGLYSILRVVAQLVKALHLGCRNRWFESSLPYYE